MVALATSVVSLAVIIEQSEVDPKDQTTLKGS